MERGRLKNLIVHTVPKRQRLMLRRIIYAPLDAIEALLGRRDELTPPRGLIFVGDRDFKKHGENFLRYCIEWGGLKPADAVLDVGCGIGRMAVPLTRYLKAPGSYEGFDIVADGIDWCARNISPRYPNFHFRVADICNAAYNPKGISRASEYRFPYGDASFDFVLLASVFTHMLTDELEHYLCEISRVLKRGGRCLITFFLLNDESQRLIDAKASAFDFTYGSGECRTIQKKTPESAVAYQESYVRRVYEKHGLTIREPVRYGSWSGRKEFLDVQDIVIAHRNDR